MECEMPGLNCSRLRPSRSGNGVLGQALRLQRVAVANEVTSILHPYALYTLVELVLRRDCGQELLGMRELDAIGVAAGASFQQLMVVGGGFARLLGYFSGPPGSVE